MTATSSTTTTDESRIAPAPFAHVDQDEVRALSEEIARLKVEKDAVILAHNYQLPEVQDIADHLGDSLGLSLIAQKAEQRTIVFCGVLFMAESAKILNPEKQVLIPSLAAGCSLSDSITAESLTDWKERYPDHTVVTYVNSSAEVKALSHICCTSANAASVVRSIDNDKILRVLSQTGGFSLNLHLRPGEHSVAVAVRDELANIDSTISVPFTPGRLVVDMN